MNILPAKFLSYRECTVESIDITHQRESKAYTRVSSPKPFGQLFDLELTTISLSMSDAMELTAWLIENARGTHGIFGVKNPFNALFIPYERNTVFASDYTPQNAVSVRASNFTPYLQVPLRVGSFFCFANHPKVYMLTGITPASPAGDSTLTFTPPLYSAVPANTLINYGNKCVFTVSAKSNVQSLTASVASGMNTSIVLSVRERG